MLTALPLIGMTTLAAAVLGQGNDFVTRTPTPTSTDSQYSQLWGKHGEAWDPAGRLPDFSFAGYHFGEDPLPDVPVVANVRDFGAVGDGEHDDTQAFHDAIEQTESGAILIPAGRYLITDFITIRKPNLVLRGEGVGQTTLWFPTPLETIKPNASATTDGVPTSNYSWSGGFITVQGWRDTTDPRGVTADADRGTHELTVASADGLAVGQRVCLELTDDADRSLLAHIDAGPPAELVNIKKTYTTRMVSRIRAIDGQRITLERALPTDVRAAWSPTLSLFTPSVYEVGIESLSFEFPDTPYGGHFKELGYNAIAIGRASDCWVRDVSIHNADSGIYLSSAMFATVQGVTLSAQRSPADGATGHHGINMGIDCLLTNFDFQTHFIHDITVDHGQSRNVVKNGRAINLSLDHHKRGCYANLFTNLDAGTGSELWRCGGGAKLGYHCAAWGTFWNIRADQPLGWPRRDIWGPDLMNLVGLTTNDPSTLDPDGRWFEAIPPAALEPADLHAAQLQRRLHSTAQR